MMVAESLRFFVYEKLNQKLEKTASSTTQSLQIQV